jgi:hypothetical protein
MRMQRRQTLMTGRAEIVLLHQALRQKIPQLAVLVIVDIVVTVNIDLSSKCRELELVRQYGIPENRV